MFAATPVTTESFTELAPSEPPTPMLRAVDQPQSLMYKFDLYRDGKRVGGGLVEAPSPAAAAWTAELTMAGGAEVSIRGFLLPHPNARSAV